MRLITETQSTSESVAGLLPKRTRQSPEIAGKRVGQALMVRVRSQGNVSLSQSCPINDANSSTGSDETRRIPAFSAGKAHDRAGYIINVVKLSIVCYGDFLNVDFANQRSLGANCV